MTRRALSSTMPRMNLSIARGRYLSAIGSVLPSLVLAACKDPAPPTVGAADGATATATATLVASAPRPIPPELRFPPCPHGAFCISDGTRLAGKDAAPAPYETCALTTRHPDDAPDAGSLGSRSVTFSAENTAAARAKTGAACCYTWVVPCPGGRAFRDATGTPSVARTMARSDWSAAIGALQIGHLSPEARESSAEHWTREAAFEHASVASFAQLTLDLLAVGAPPDLLVATQRAALDEIEHARISFAIASAYGAAAVGPAALAASPGRCRTLADIARLTFIDACVGESVAAASLAEDSRAAADPVLRELLAGMAEDEERHAELAWRIVAWALRSGDPNVAHAVAAAQAHVIDELAALTREAAPTSRHALRADVLREVVLPCSVALLEGQGAQGTTGTASRSARA